GDHGHREQSAGVGVALRAAVHDGRRHRQRVHRGRGSPVSRRARGDRPRAVHHHVDRQQPLAAVDLEHGPKRRTLAGRRSSAGRGGRMSRITRRKLLSALFVGFCAMSVLVALVPVALILFFVVSQGIQSLNLNFFTHMPTPVGESGGGMANAIVGTLILTGLGSIFALPIGILSGVYTSEYAGSRFASAIRFAADTLNGVPSIVIGVFAYGVAVPPVPPVTPPARGLALRRVVSPPPAPTP